MRLTSKVLAPIALIGILTGGDTAHAQLFGSRVSVPGPRASRPAPRYAPPQFPATARGFGVDISQANPLKSGTVANRKTTDVVVGAATFGQGRTRDNTAGYAETWKAEPSGRPQNQAVVTNEGAVHAPRRKPTLQTDPGVQVIRRKPASMGMNPSYPTTPNRNQAGLELATGIVNLVGSGIQQAQRSQYYRPPQYYQPPQFQRQPGYYQQTRYYQQPQSYARPRPPAYYYRP